MLVAMQRKNNPTYAAVIEDIIQIGEDLFLVAMSRQTMVAPEFSKETLVAPGNKKH